MRGGQWLTYRYFVHSPVLRIPKIIIVRLDACNAEKSADSRMFNEPVKLAGCILLRTWQQKRPPSRWTPKYCPQSQYSWWTKEYPSIVPYVISICPPSSHVTHFGMHSIAKAQNAFPSIWFISVNGCLGIAVPPKPKFGGRLSTNFSRC
jgi:hypothetical protein